MNKYLSRYTPQKSHFILLISAITGSYFIFNILYFTFDGIYLISISCVFGYLLGLYINRKKKVNKWNFNRYSLFNKLHSLTYMFIFFISIAFINNNIFLGDEKKLNSEIIAKKEALGRDHANKFIINIEGFTQKTIPTSSELFSKYKAGDKIQIKVNKSILGFDVITKIHYQ
mgnify:CR=1 FL=1